MKLLSAAVLAASLTVGLGGSANAGLATGDIYNFTVWSGSYSALGINGNADLADAPSVPSSVSFTYTGPIDFANLASQSSPNLASAFFGTSPDITNFSSNTTLFGSVQDFLTKDTLSNTGFSGSSLVTFMEITGTYAANPGTTVSVTHDDGASLYTGLNNNPVILSPGPVSQTTNTADLTPPTAATGDNFMLVYVEANGAPSILEVTTMSVPEPGSLALLGTGMVALGLVLRRRRRPTITGPTAR